MATISFRLRKETTSRSIYLIFSYGRGNELRYSTGWKLNDTKNWNPDKGRVKSVIAEPQASNINKSIGKLEIFANNLYQELVTSNIEITNRVLRNEIDLFLNRKPTKETPTSYKTLLDCYKWYYTYYSNHSLPTTKKPLAPGTIKSYKTSYSVLKEFSENVYAINYGRIDMEFYADFIQFLNGKGFSKNYVSNHIKMLKTVMNHAWEKKFHNNLAYKSKAFAKINEDVFSIYLSLEELKSLENLELTGKYKNARDLFLIGAHTGLRVSDFNRLTKENIKSSGKLNYIEITTKKTGTIISIPINSTVDRILKQRKGNPPNKMPEQHINQVLKEIGEKAKIDEEVEFKKTIGGEVVLIKKKKYDLMTNHTARRSFCTNAYLAGMPTLDIMAISGHKTEKSFYKYIQVSNLERLRKIAQHPFFN